MSNMRYVIFDTETTGLRAGIDDVIQFAYLVIDEKGAVYDAGNHYFLTDSDISQGAYKVHGLTHAFLEEHAHGNFLQDFVLNSALFNDNDADITFIGYNVDFDIKMVVSKMRSRGYSAPSFGFNISKLNQDRGRYNYCLMRGLANRYQWGKWKKLGEARNIVLNDVDDSRFTSFIEGLKAEFDLDLRDDVTFHDAMYDVVVTAYMLIKCRNDLK